MRACFRGVTREIACLRTRRIQGPELIRACMYYTASHRYITKHDTYLQGVEHAYIKLFNALDYRKHKARVTKHAFIVSFIKMHILCGKHGNLDDVRRELRVESLRIPVALCHR